MGLFSFLKKKRGDHEIAIEFIDVDKVFQNPYQPRRTFHRDAMDQLKRSIQENGILVPVLARKVNRGYELACGERRLRASRELGLKTIPAIIRDLSTPQMVELALIENLIRDDLIPVEEAETYERLKKEFAIKSEKEIAEKFHLSEESVQRYKALANLPIILKKALASSLITEEQAFNLAKVRDEPEMHKLLSGVIQKDISTQQLMETVNNGKTLNATESPS